MRCEDPSGEDLPDETTKAAAESLRDQMIEEGIPKTAISVKRTPKELWPEMNDTEQER